MDESPEKSGDKKQWTGKELARDLAKYVQSTQWMAWCEMPLGSVWAGVQRADVVAVSKSYTPVVKIFEVKVDRGDYLADITRQKYLGYFKSCNFLYFATPAGLLKTEEVPVGCGLITRNEYTWHAVKSARSNEFKIGQEFLLALLMKGFDDYWESYRSKERREQEVRVYTTLKQAYRDYGVQVAADVARAQEFVHTAEEYKAEISALLGKDIGKFHDAVSDLKEEVRKLMAQYRHIRLALPLAEMAIRLFDGEIFFQNPVTELENILSQARKQFPEKVKTEC